MNSMQLFLVIIWITISGSFSSTWSSSINSMFSVRNMIPRTVGVNTDLIESIANGAQMAMDHCRDIFKWDRWNCPESEFSRRHKQTPTREQAITHAIVSAGLVHAVTRNCSKGHLKGCGCEARLSGPVPAYEPSFPDGESNSFLASRSNKKIKIDWSWGGCSDDVGYGQAIAKTVLDQLERGSDSQAQVHLHNNLVGRTVVRNTMVKRCRCHGISGSCSLQTCWMQVAPFVKIASVLRQRYKKAVMIGFENRSNRLSAGSSVIESHPHINAHQLVFIENSPDYCLANNTTGWPGTKGRMCSRSRLETTSLLEKRSCRTLCRSCGHRVRKQKRQLTWKCNCTFKWCCEVQCDTCAETVDEFFCQ